MPGRMGVVWWGSFSVVIAPSSSFPPFISFSAALMLVLSTPNQIPTKRQEEEQILGERGKGQKRSVQTTCDCVDHDLTSSASFANTSSLEDFGRNLYYYGSFFQSQTLGSHDGWDDTPWIQWKQLLVIRSVGLDNIN